MLVNPLSEKNYSDPFVTYDKKTGYYYLLASCQSNVMSVFRSRKVGDLLKNGEKKDVYVCGANGIYGPMWAPEMYKIGDKWYIYTSCRKKWDDNMFAERKQILILKSGTEDPFDGFEFGSMPDGDVFAIDPTVFFIDGKQYICYSEVAKDGVQILTVREMKNPLCYTKKRAEISRPKFDWELAEGYRGGNAINEGAFFLERGNRKFIIYSANGCWSDDYCLGVLEYTGGEVCDAKNWKKHPDPLFVKGNGIFGVGHASFFNSPDNSEVWCAYHCLLKSNPQLTETDRFVFVQKIDFDKNDYPVMGNPVCAGEKLPSPSGEK